MHVIVDPGLRKHRRRIEALFAVIHPRGLLKTLQLGVHVGPAVSPLYMYDGLKVEVSGSVPDVRDDKPARIRLVEEVPLERFLDEQYFRHMLHALIGRFLRHELDEGFFVGDSSPYDPHRTVVNGG